MVDRSQNERFTKCVIADHILDHAIDWIYRFLKPEEVFLAEDLEDWANRNGFVKRDEVEKS